MIYINNSYVTTMSYRGSIFCVNLKKKTCNKKSFFSLLPNSKFYKYRNSNDYYKIYSDQRCTRNMSIIQYNRIKGFLVLTSGP